MASLPPSSDFNGSTVTEGQQKTFINSLRDFLAGLLGTTGTVATALQTLKVLFSAFSAKNSAYTIVAGDQGRVIKATGTWTLSLTSVATLREGFVFAVRNIGSGTITIYPQGAETIDGTATLQIGPGFSAIVVCDGTGWLSFGRAGNSFTENIAIANTWPGIVLTDTEAALSRTIVGCDGYVCLLCNDGSIGAFFSPDKTARIYSTLFVGESGAYMATNGDIYMPWIGANLSTVLNWKVSYDPGFNSVGSLCLAIKQTTNAVASGGTISGASLKPVGLNLGYNPVYYAGGSALSGTWRCLGYTVGSMTTIITLWQKIAA